MLRIPSSIFSENEIEDIRRVEHRRRKPRTGATSSDPVHDEVVVRFRAVSARDYAQSHVVNFAACVNEEGKPTAGVRLEIPEHLRIVFLDLQHYGRLLYKQHGQGFKRHIRFDDRNLSLYMDIKLPSTEEWLFVDHKLAKEGGGDKKKSTAFTRERLASSISSAGSGTDEVEVLPSPSPLPTSRTLEKFARKTNKKPGEWE